MENQASKGFRDPVHGYIEFCPFLVKVINTPQFQRLRKIKQLSLGYYVYPGACHNRFEHSLGTCHLAGKLVRHLRENLPENVTISDKDVFCVELAGLCHDLGHGPFSHLFDGEFLKHRSIKVEWNHEKGSLDMLDHLFEKNDLINTFNEDGSFEKKYNEEFGKEDLKFVKKMIDPSYDKVEVENGREFFYEIISNSKSGVDVDKWDYFARDSYYLGIKSSFEHNRFLALTKVLEVEDENNRNTKKKTCISVRDKECINLYEMFHTRNALYKRAYKHKTVVAINAMVSDALAYANDFILTKGRKLSETIEDMHAFELLNDSVLDLIERSEEESGDMGKAKKLLKRLSSRRLYKYIGNFLIQGKKPVKCSSHELRKKISQKDYEETKKKAMDAKNELLKNMKDLSEEEVHVEMDAKNELMKKDLSEEVHVEVVKFDYGMKNSNPVDCFNFYTKENPNVAKSISKEEVSHMLPEIFLEQELFVYCKSEDKNVLEKVENCFSSWKKKRLKKKRRFSNFF